MIRARRCGLTTSTSSLLIRRASTNTFVDTLIQRPQETGDREYTALFELDFYLDQRSIMGNGKWKRQIYKTATSNHWCEPGHSTNETLFFLLLGHTFIARSICWLLLGIREGNGVLSFDLLSFTRNLFCFFRLFIYLSLRVWTNRTSSSASKQIPHSWYFFFLQQHNILDRVLFCLEKN